VSWWAWRWACPGYKMGKVAASRRDQLHAFEAHATTQTQEAEPCSAPQGGSVRQQRFKATCQSLRDGSLYYRFDELKRCYGYQ